MVTSSNKDKRPLQPKYHKILPHMYIYIIKEEFISAFMFLGSNLSKLSYTSLAFTKFLLFIYLFIFSHNFHDIISLFFFYHFLRLYIYIYILHSF